MKIIPILLSCILTGIIFIFGVKPALAFCGFYVAKADTSLYNQASQVIIARDRRRTVLTMSNDYQGDVKDFAMVVPVPVVLTEEQVHVGDPKIIKRIDAFSAPLLVESFEDHPCISWFKYEALASTSFPKKALGVTVEKQFSVGEYDILILSAEESNGLETWLAQNGYQLSQDARDLLQPYIRQGMKFLVARVNLKEFDNNAFERLRPISISYESPKFMLPIRLGMSNAKAEQDLIVYLLSPTGQVELTNYRTVKVPSYFSIPEFVQTEFADFYQVIFQKDYEEQNKQAAFLEYAGDMNSKCLICYADPLTPEELKQAGVFWLDGSPNKFGSGDVFLTRLHIRYTRDKFPEDLRFQQTSNREEFEGRYSVTHPFRGEIPKEINCSTSSRERYQQKVEKKQEQAIKNLALWTGWKIEDIRNKIDRFNYQQ